MAKEIANVISEDQLAMMRENFPAEPASNRVIIPRIVFKSQDVMEGTGKDKKVVTEAGTFFTEVQTEKFDENRRNIWDKTEIGSSMEGIIIYQRKQLRMYDEDTEKYTSSPIFDTNDEVVPIFCDRKEVARGTRDELRALYEFIGDDGKKRSKLEDNRILYILKDDTMYQLNLRGSSMYSFLGYARTVLVPSVVTAFSSEAMQKGSIEWNKMTFTSARDITNEEAVIVVEKQTELREAIALQKEHFANQ